AYCRDKEPWPPGRGPPPQDTKPTEPRARLPGAHADGMTSGFLPEWRITVSMRAAAPARVRSCPLSANNRDPVRANEAGLREQAVLRASTGRCGMMSRWTKFA